MCIYIYTCLYIDIHRPVEIYRGFVAIWVLFVFQIEQNFMHSAPDLPLAILMSLSVLLDDTPGKKYLKTF